MKVTKKKFVELRRVVRAEYIASELSMPLYIKSKDHLDVKPVSFIQKIIDVLFRRKK